MKENLRDYAKLGLVYQLLHPKCTADPDYHTDTLLAFAERSDIETFDCCIPYGDDRRAKVIPALRECGKEVVCTPHLFPLRKISFVSPCPQEQAIIRLVMQDQVEAASAAGAIAMLFPSGADVPDNRDAGRAAFTDFCRWICPELASRKMFAMLEPFDRTIDKKFLYGPTTECMELMDTLAAEGIDNMGLEIDMAHLPLMYESFEHSIRLAAPYIGRVHLGNCVMRDTRSPFYGDMHPPIGIEGGEIDVPQLVEILRLLLEVGYLNRDRYASLVVEIQPFPGRSVDDSVADNFERLERAWRQA